MKLKDRIGKISGVVLVLDILLCVLSRLFFSFAETYTIQYIMAMVYTYTYYAAIFLLIAWCVLNIRTLKEMLRKVIVALKRKPSLIPLMMLLITFLYYSLNLTSVSKTTALIQGKGMGLSQFCIMLLSMLSMLCMLNAFPRRKKANVPMVVLVYVMLAVLFYCDSHYIGRITAALNREQSPIVISLDTAYVAMANNMLANHKIMVLITAALTATLPLYSKLIRKIKTSVAVEDNGDMGKIEIEE